MYHAPGLFYVYRREMIGVRRGALTDGVSGGAPADGVRRGALTYGVRRGTPADWGQNISVTRPGPWYIVGPMKRSDAQYAMLRCFPGTFW